jgi:heavy metal translocating P-type ATPase
MSVTHPTRRWPTAISVFKPAPGTGWPLPLMLILLAAAGGLSVGFLFYLGGLPRFARVTWAAALIPSLVHLAIEIVTELRRRNTGLDIVAALSMTLALLLGETLVGAIVALMYSGGQMLERFAEQRARREMSELLSRVPKTATRHSGQTLQEIALEAVAPGDRLLVRSGEAVPADGTLLSEHAMLDQSMLTGESLPVRRRTGEELPSGSINLGAAFDLLVVRAAKESSYATIVRLVENAQSVKAPMARLADRYGVWLLVVTTMIAGGTWLLSGEAARALAVLVVATPCPLILAIPVAIMSGISHIAKHGVLVKDGGALETLARIQTVVIDKTGTLTEGRARLVRIEPRAGLAGEELLRLAATLDLASNHVVATALVATAHERGLVLGRPTDVQETPGVGIEGVVEGRRIALGGSSFVAHRLRASAARHIDPSLQQGEPSIAMAIDGQFAGEFILADRVRGDIAHSIERFRGAGVARIVLASGDRPEIVQSVGLHLRIDEVLASLAPQDKVAVVLRERERACTMMIGDGVNDAPALAAADVGVAMGVRGAAASAEVADIVLLVDRIGSLADAIEIARRARRIALQSANVGIGLSLAAMVVAAIGWLPPVQGALLQEIIDVGVVLNALRALGGGPPHLATDPVSGGPQSRWLKPG